MDIDIVEKNFLISDLFSLDNNIRINAIEKLSEFDDEESLSALTKLSNDPDPAIRYFVKKNINKANSRKSEQNNILTKNDTNQINLQASIFNQKILQDIIIGSGQKEKIEALKEIDKSKCYSFLPFLISRLNIETDNFVIATLVKLIGKMGDESHIAIITDYLNNQDKRVVANAVEGLEFIGSSKIIPLLLPLLNDSDNRVKANTVKALAKFDETNVIEILQKMIGSDEVWMRDSAIFALSKIKSKKALELLENATKDSNENIASHATNVLKSINNNFYESEETIQTENIIDECSSLEHSDFNYDNESDICEICNYLCYSGFKKAPVAIHNLLNNYKELKENSKLLAIELDKDLNNLENIELLSAHEKALNNEIKKSNESLYFTFNGVGEIIINETIKNKLPLNDLTLPIIEIKNKLDDINNDLLTNEKYKTFLGKLTKNQRQKEYEKTKISLSDAIKNLEALIIEEQIEEDFNTEVLTEKIAAIQKIRKQLSENIKELNKIILQKNDIISVYDINLENFNLQNNGIIQKIQKLKETIKSNETNIEKIELNIADFIINKENIKWDIEIIDEYLLKIKTKDAKCNADENIYKYETPELLDKILTTDHIEPDFYKHCLEDSYLDIAKKIFIGQDAIITYYKNIVEKMNLPDLTSKVKCSSNQLNNIFSIAQKLANYFKIKQPDIYVCYGETFGLNSSGLACPWLEINSETIEDINDEELCFLIGRQFAHIQCNHLFYNIIIDKMIEISEEINLSKIPGLGMIPGLSLLDNKSFINKNLKIALYPYKRSAEYSADAAGYLATGGNFDACCSAILKQTLERPQIASKTSIKEFYKQVEIIDSMTGFMANRGKADEEFPYGQFRIRELIKFVSSERGKLAIKATKKMVIAND